MGTFNDQMIDAMEKAEARAIADCKEDYSEEIIIKAAAQIVAARELSGEHDTFCGFQNEVTAIVQGQTLALGEY